MILKPFIKIILGVLMFKYLLIHSLPPLPSWVQITKSSFIFSNKFIIIDLIDILW